MIQSYAKCIGAKFASSDETRDRLNEEIRSALRVLGVADEELS